MDLGRDENVSFCSYNESTLSKSMKMVNVPLSRNVTENSQRLRLSVL